MKCSKSKKDRQYKMTQTKRNEQTPIYNTNTLTYWDECRCSANTTFMYIFPYIVKIEVAV